MLSKQTAMVKSDKVFKVGECSSDRQMIFLSELQDLDPF